MSLYEFILLACVFVGLLFFYRIAGRWVKRLRPSTARAANIASLAITIAGIALWFALGDNRFMPVAAVGVAAYFLFAQRGNGAESA
jgi:hypothetical protein